LPDSSDTLGGNIGISYATEKLCTLAIVETPKPFVQAVADLESAVKNHGFGVLHIHNLGTTLRNKGIGFAEECKIFEVCNPQQAANVLSCDMRLNRALPCRISVYTEQGQTKIGLIKPAPCCPPCRTMPS